MIILSWIISPIRSGSRHCQIRNLPAKSKMISFAGAWVNQSGSLHCHQEVRVYGDASEQESKPSFFSLGFTFNGRGCYASESFSIGETFLESVQVKFVISYKY